jgi:tetratricopeptide (TPR) repeat protein
MVVVNGVGFLVGMMHVGPREMAWNHSDVWGYWVAQPVAFWSYVKLMAWPVGLHIDHAFPHPGWVWAALGAAALLGAVWLVLRWRRSFPIPFYALVWMLIMFAPAGLVPNSDLLNESRAYLALAGFALIVSWMVADILTPRAGARSPAIAMVLLTVLMVPVTIERNRLWKNDVEIWRDAAAKSPRKDRVRYNLGFALARQGQFEAARAEFEKARQLNPLDDLSYAALGYCAEVGEQWQLARDFYERAIELNPDNAYARQGISRLDMGRQE